MEKTPINVRIETTLVGYIRAVASQQDKSFTEVIESMFKIALQNRHDVDKDLEKKRIVALESIKFEEADALIRIELKKAYSVENFRKLIYRLQQSRDVSKHRRIEVLKAMMSRIEEIFGKKSPEYKECLRIARASETIKGDGKCCKSNESY